MGIYWRGCGHVLKWAQWLTRRKKTRTCVWDGWEFFSDWPACRIVSLCSMSVMFIASRSSLSSVQKSLSTSYPFIWNISAYWCNPRGPRNLLIPMSFMVYHTVPAENEMMACCFFRDCCRLRSESLAVSWCLLLILGRLNGSGIVAHPLVCLLCDPIGRGTVSGPFNRQPSPWRNAQVCMWTRLAPTRPCLILW